MTPMHSIDFDEKSLRRANREQSALDLNLSTSDISKLAILRSFERDCLDEYSAHTLDELCVELARGGQKSDIDILCILRGLTMEKKDIEHARMVAYNSRLLAAYTCFSADRTRMNIIFLRFMMYARAGETVYEFINRINRSASVRLQGYGYCATWDAINLTWIGMDAEICMRNSAIARTIRIHLADYLIPQLADIVGQYLA